jgi:hypothetical protein
LLLLALPLLLLVLLLLLLVASVKQLLTAALPAVKRSLGFFWGHISVDIDFSVIVRV